jgi:hypothetical protein
MKNKLVDLNDHLFAQLERLSDEDLSGDALLVEVERSKAVVGLADQVVDIARLRLNAVRVVATHGDRFKAPLQSMLQAPAIEG